MRYENWWPATGCPIRGTEPQTLACVGCGATIGGIDKAENIEWMAAHERIEWMAAHERSCAGLSAMKLNRSLVVSENVTSNLDTCTVSGVTFYATGRRLAEPILLRGAYGERIGDQLRTCVVCGKTQPVDDFNLCLDVMTSNGPGGDAEDSYICDEDAPSVVAAIRALAQRRSRSSVAFLDEDLLCEDA